MKIVLAGGTGFIGRGLFPQLISNHHEVFLLSRNPGRLSIPELAGLFAWDALNLGPWTGCLEGADVVVNLAGESVVGPRWTPKQKQKIVASRIDATKLLVEAFGRLSQKPSLLLNASATGYYGNVEEGEVDEDSLCGGDFLAATCALWEEEALKAQKFGVRVVCLRMGVVLEKDGGALKKMIGPFKMFLGGPLGSGHQWFPWIHRDDVVGAILFLINKKNICGPVNLAAPHPVTLSDFCSNLGKILHRPSWLPLPAFILRGLMGEGAGLFLSGQKAFPKKLIDAGYPFKYEKIDQALSAVFSS